VYKCSGYDTLAPELQDTPKIVAYRTVLQLRLDAFTGSGLEIDGDFTCLLAMAKKDDLHSQVIATQLLVTAHMMMSKVPYR
jgi:hypothetical protein